MAISSNALFHFVNKREYLEKILKGDFAPRYCLEHFDFKLLQLKDIYILMKCFCDIPLSQITNHTKTYGNYGIGFTKEWGKKNGISPIIYVYKNSDTYKSIQRIYSDNLNEAYNEYQKKKTETARNKIFEALSIIAYIKPIEGKMEREGESIDILFYNEREWRFVPNKLLKNNNGIMNETLILPSDMIDKNPNLKNVLNNLAERNSKIRYAPEDVKYIFVKNEADKDYICNKLMGFDNFNENQKLKMISKILTIKQIEEDF